MGEKARRSPGPVTPRGRPLVGERGESARPVVRVYGGLERATPEERASAWGALSGCFLTIWTEPRETIRRIVTVDPHYWVVPLTVLGGSTNALLAFRGVGPRPSGLLATVLTACTIGPLLNIAWLWAGAWSVRALGFLALRGEAKPVEMRAALAWANVPQVLLFPVALLGRVFFGARLMASPAAGGPSLALAVLGAICLGLTVLIAANTVAEVQGYRSAWRGLRNLVLPLGLLFLLWGGFVLLRVFIVLHSLQP